MPPRSLGVFDRPLQIGCLLHCLTPASFYTQDIRLSPTGQDILYLYGAAFYFTPGFNQCNNIWLCSVAGAVPPENPSLFISYFLVKGNGSHQ
jgi:hypothetical protein